MSSLIQKYAAEPITLLQNQTVSDGKTIFEDSISTAAIVSDFSKADFDLFGRIARGKIFYVPPMESPPSLPGQILHDGKTYDIQEIRTYKSLAGQMLGYKIAVAEQTTQIGKM